MLQKKTGAKVIHIENKGYGNALIGGIKFANGKYIIIGDADDSYDFNIVVRMPFILKATYLRSFDVYYEKSLNP